jgi:hypothetical protein
VRYVGLGRQANSAADYMAVDIAAMTLYSGAPDVASLEAHFATKYAL